MTNQMMPMDSHRDDMQLQGVSAEMMQAAFANMADLLRAMNDRISDLEACIRHLTKVTPAQANGLNRAIRDRAHALAEQYRAPDGCDKAIVAEIRKAVKATCGIGSMRDLAQCDYAVAQKQIECWDDYRTIKGIVRAAREGR